MKAQKKLRRANINWFSLLGGRFLANLVLILGTLWPGRANARALKDKAWYQRRLLEIAATERMLRSTNIVSAPFKSKKRKISLNSCSSSWMTYVAYKEILFVFFF